MQKIVFLFVYQIVPSRLHKICLVSLFHIMCQQCNVSISVHSTSLYWNQTWCAEKWQASSRSLNGENAVAVTLKAGRDSALQREIFVVFCDNRYQTAALCWNASPVDLTWSLSLDAHQTLCAAICVTFTWWTMWGHSSDISFCLGSIWQRGSTLLSARKHDRVLEFLKGHYPFSEHLTRN